MTDYDPGNIFAKIIAGEIPAHKVYEDDKTLAFMDIMPRTEGHTLVIPKAGSRNLLSIEDEDLCALMKTVKKVARAVRKAFDADGVLIQQFNEPAAGQMVFHTHVHIIPRHEGAPLKPHTGEMADEEALKESAEKIRQALKALEEEAA